MLLSGFYLSSYTIITNQFMKVELSYFYTQTEHFVDVKKVYVIGGRGGNGSIHFNSEPRKEFGGPDGGNGGHGGHVVITCKIFSLW